MIREANREAAARQQAMLEDSVYRPFEAHAAKAAQVQSRVKALDKIEKIELPKKRRVVKFDRTRRVRSGGHAGTGAEGMGAASHDGVTMTIRGERWCVMGKNGAKSTLLKMVRSGRADGGRSNWAPAADRLFAQPLDLLDGSDDRRQPERFPDERLSAAPAGAFQFQ